MDFKKEKRPVYLVAGALTELIAGFAYAWSVVQGPLIEKYGWTQTAASLAFTLLFVFTMVAQLTIGKRIAKLKVKTSLAISAVLYGIGMVGCGLIRGSILELYLYFGFFVGVSGAFAYPVLISYGVRLYPEKRGFGGGIMAAGFAMGALLWAPITAYLYQKTGNISLPFIILGIFFFIATLVLSRLIADIPPRFEEEFNQGEQKAQKGLFEKSRMEMFKSPFLYLVYPSLIVGIVTGLMIVTQGSGIVRTTFGMSVQTASVIVGLISTASAAGRLGWGAVSDRLGRQRVLIMIHCLMGFAMIMLLSVRSEPVYIVMLLITGLCYGGFSTMVAPLTSDIFGSIHFSENYSFMFSAFGVSSVIGPPLIAALKESTGGFTGAFSFGVIFSIIGAVLALLLSISVRRVKAKRAAGIESVQS
ncbi:MFS transporter [Papillibacter cinnamivorans]|uniref:MFS transporter, OFA family, oxalate/formate antiporter n=1 Tax=Papillibacter cinnamivorans DSM 12816 TaxID=1122930 RepID=A0A1W2C9M5_9FIRM|nr:MFS transporter [Papillibacter cinnamivorans]SMC81883.1 MFS transporter, OFA family, oxalate/formate antiporter [Papillibacter cinnamivorans DSM 12816]